MARFSKSNLEWADQHEAGECELSLTAFAIWRTIGADKDFPFNGLGVYQVQWLGCLACSKDAPKYGQQISLDDLVLTEGTTL